MKQFNDKFTRIVTFRDFVGEMTATYRRTSVPTTTITQSKDAYDFMYPYFDQIMDDHEEVKILHLNNANKTVNVHHCTIGTDTGSLVPINHILRQALIIQTKGIIMFHNHPSSNLKPSKADLDITDKLSKACKLMDIKLLDSIILTRESFYSFADNNQM